ncbi:hypothetical protein HK098_005577 [Nowakowskiella sp. JEL0407]|nr:hypothetical protein HK098_005577 [Nowakowskiella sp. JEL0407]
MKSFTLLLIVIAVFTVTANARAIEARASPLICPLCIRAPTCDLKCEEGLQCTFVGPCPCTAKQVCLPKPKPTGLICPLCFVKPSCDLKCGESEKCMLEGPCECTATPKCVPVKPSPTPDPNCPLLWCKRFATCDLVDCKDGYKCVIKGDCPCTAVAVCEPIASTKSSPKPTTTTTVTKVSPKVSPTGPVICPLCYRECALECAKGYHCEYNGPCPCTAPQICVKDTVTPVTTTTTTKKIILPTIVVPPPIN